MTIKEEERLIACKIIKIDQVSALKKELQWLRICDNMNGCVENYESYLTSSYMLSLMERMNGDLGK